ncbi:MAG TPA: DedA family protein [Methylomirabilota bacterium]|jgi:membrane protein DedA with SNARE-associated domain|nr:DedA family protein [Methylomirabilota bacterium]
MGALEQFLEEFTYAGIFLALFLGGIGVPLPEEVPVLTAGVLAHEQVVRWWLALPLCVLGVLSGDVVLYWAGRHWGERVLAWRLVRRVLSPEREQTLKEAYHRHGVKIVFTARHVVGLRAAAFLTAGIVRIPFPRFLAADAAAAMVGVPISFGLAYFFTDQLHEIMTDVHRAQRWALLVAFVVAAVWITVHAWRRGTRLEREAQAGRDSAAGQS